MPIIISKKAQRFAKRIGVTSARGLRDVECGLHSNIPRCCIIFYIKAWCPLLDSEKELNSMDMGITDYRDSYHDLIMRMLGPSDKYPRKVAINGGISKARYIVCPKCLYEKTFNKLKKCDCRRYKAIVLAKE